LREPDLGDELGDGRFGLRQAADDAQPVDVGECLVDETELAQVAGLVDDGRERRTDSGGGGGQRGGSRAGSVASTTVYINGC
jgi:hypothetical protein